MQTCGYGHSIWIKFRNKFSELQKKICGYWPKSNEFDTRWKECVATDLGQHPGNRVLVKLHSSVFHDYDTISRFLYTHFYHGKVDSIITICFAQIKS